MNTETLHLILSAGLVAAAAALDVAANLMLARSDGFKKRLIGIGALVLVGLAFYCLSLAVQYMDLAVAYSMWGSLGILGTSLCGWLFLRQRLKPCAFFGMGLLIIGMILLRTS
ncbi:MAG: multidrug efflux SMR transporter [Desulfovibrio sp.]|uniref:DMT family transporter n=1 Tax=Desulfovibrio TaxID=872 RepID=UPI0026EB7C19|nr:MULTISPECIES: multidrug efflux SMR transporter [Desulfovibrio]MBS5808049.1 multidrug efflux SMR transporter [Desulfovibrio piger]MEE0071716.1 multidrug efflux SMR transporter [Desulfovibrio sp.]